MAAPRDRARSFSIVVGVAVALGLVVATVSSAGLGVLAHTVCDLGQSKGSETLFTAYSLTNVPYGGWTFYEAHFSLYELFGFTIATATGLVGDGNLSTGYFETEDWTLEPQSNVSVSGPGVNSPCRSEYTVVFSAGDPDVSFQGLALQGPGNTSNIGEPTSFNNSAAPSVTFANGFASANWPAVDTCGQPSTELNFSSTRFDVLAEVPGPAGPLQTVYAMDVAENFTYHFPADGGIWSVDDLQLNTPLPGPGLAFDWSAC